MLTVTLLLAFLESESSLFLPENSLEKALPLRSLLYVGEVIGDVGSSVGDIALGEVVGSSLSFLCLLKTAVKECLRFGSCFGLVAGGEVGAASTGCCFFFLSENLEKDFDLVSVSGEIGDVGEVASFSTEEKIKQKSLETFSTKEKNRNCPGRQKIIEI